MHHNFRSGGKRTNLIGSNPLTALRSRPYDGKIAGLYDLEETLGRGHFAVVKLARHVFTGEKVAVKVIDKSKLDEVSKAHLFQEVRCMKLVQHPNVVRLYEVIDTATKLYLVLELGDGGDLYEYILKHDTGLPETVAKEYFIQIVRAISYCHQLHVVHRDLKPENVVFFKKQGIVKLTDFGFSNKFYPGQKLETSCGSLAYSAPEILLGDSYEAPAVDVWSLGVILYMLVCGQPPFQEANDSETLTMIMDCKYDIPAHVSENCQNLISRMLVRNPDKRATLLEITKHPWLYDGKHDTPEILPLVSKEQLSEEDHNLIVQKIVNGNIASKEEILESLDRNEYNHITATYYLLAERKLRSKTYEQLNKNKRPDHLSVSQSPHVPEKGNCPTVKPCLLSVPRTPGDLPQRSRKCSIVQEDDEEEDISPCSRQENLGQPLNRRGSRSEGRLNLTLQERIADSERRKPIEKISDQKNNTRNTKEVYIKPSINKSIVQLELPKVSIITTNSELDTVENEALKIPGTSHVETCSHLQLNEIFEDTELFSTSDATPRKCVNRNQLHDQRKLKFHKSRTTSCSSSDASDDDSEKRKKQAQKLNSSSKSYQGRRDSHDDSSDSQEPGTAAGSSGNKKINTTTLSLHSSKSTDSQKHKMRNNTNNGKKNVCNTNLMFGRRQKVVKKRNGKTRLRESQSLNRITEVQEDGSQAAVIPPTLLNMQGTFPPKVKSIGAKILQSFNKTIKKSDEKYLRIDYKIVPVSRNSAGNSLDDNIKNINVIQDNHKVEKCSSKKNQILEKYFHVHKKICIPIPSFLTKNRLYKAQSCSSLTKKKIFLNSDTLPHMSYNVVRNEGDVNQNENNKLGRCSPNILDLNSVCNELTEICAIQIGNASKCCSFC